MSRDAKKSKSSKACSELRELLIDALASFVWGEYARAAKLYRQALEQTGDDVESSLLAEILEGLQHVHCAIEETERELPSLQAASDAEPEDPAKHFYLALGLSRLGRPDEALREYRAALENPEGLCADCFRHLWSNIGWHYFRQGEYQESLKWFDQTYFVATFDEASGEGMVVKGSMYAAI
jgi:tetratricopeptide (TPR) repeat protein